MDKLRGWCRRKLKMKYGHVKRMAEGDEEDLKMKTVSKATSE